VFPDTCTILGRAEGLIVGPRFSGDPKLKAGIAKHNNVKRVKAPETAYGCGRGKKL
jgi:hypothetical protein